MYFVDKNILFDYLRVVYFKESLDFYKLSCLIVLMVNERKFKAFISDATLFSVGNYLRYKLERAKETEIEFKVRIALKNIFSGNWETIGLTKEEFLECLNDSRLHYEDAYQLKCALKKTKNFITNNLKDFEKIQELNLLAPKQFISNFEKNEIKQAEEKLNKILREQ